MNRPYFAAETDKNFHIFQKDAIKQIDNLFDELTGLSPQELADLFLKHNAKGIRVSGSSCPLSRYIKIKTNLYAIIHPPECKVLDNIYYFHLCTYQLPDLILEFIKQFNDRKFPELVQNT